MTRSVTGAGSGALLWRGKRDGVEGGQALWFAAPALVAVGFLIAAPIVYSAWMAISDTRIDGSSRGFVGSANFGRLLRDEQFWSALGVTTHLFLVSLVIEIGLGIALGLLLSQDVRGRRALQAMILTPSMIAPVAVGFAWLLLLDPSIGPINDALSWVGIAPVAWLGDPSIAPWAIVVVDVWQWTPFVGFVVAAGILGIPGEMLDAASLDRANGLERLWFIVLPLLRPTLAAVGVLRAVDLIRFFDTIYVMTQGGPLNKTTTLNVYGYQKAFVDLQPSYGAAVQFALLGVTAVVAILTWVLADRVRSQDRA